MESSSEDRIGNMKPNIDLRFSPTPACSCQVRSAIRVVASESKPTKGMLYYCCSSNHCGFFKWCKPDYASWNPGVVTSNKECNESRSWSTPAGTPVEGSTFCTGENENEVNSRCARFEMRDGYIHVGWVVCALLLLLIVVCLKYG